MIIISAWVGGASLHILVPYQETCITSVVASFNLNTYTYNHTGDPLAHSPLYFPYVIYTYLRLVKAPRCWVIMMHACWMQMDCQSCHSHPLTSQCWMCMWLYLTLHYKSVAYTQETNIIIFLFMFYISWQQKTSRLEAKTMHFWYQYTLPCTVLLVLHSEYWLRLG